MELTDTDLAWFVDNRLRLPAGSRDKFLAQVDSLIRLFSAAAAGDPSLKIAGFRKTGSLVKDTVLRPGDGVSVDADVAVFLGSDGAYGDLASLHSRIRKLLISIYPTKRPEDFTVQSRTLGIVYRGSGLEVDLVPVIPIGGEYCLQPSFEGRPFLKTSISGQLDFIAKRKEADSRFTHLVRMLKHWRNEQDLEGLGSYLIELLVSHLQDREGPALSLETGLLRFFLFIAQTKLLEPVVFPYGWAPSLPESRPIVLDPVNPQNNVAERMTSAEWTEILGRAREALEALTTARRNGYKGETVEFWKGVFGRSFGIGE